MINILPFGWHATRIAVSMPDVRFQSLEDGDLADLWYAVSGQAIRHPDRFKTLADALLDELLERRGEGLNPWLEQRFREIRLVDSREDAETNESVSPEALTDTPKATRKC
jgi:hypothetical protein